MSKARNIADLGSNDVLDTNANGVTVTGSLTADGLTVETTADNGAVIEAHDNLTTTYPLKVQNAAGSGRLEIGTYGINNNIDLKIQTADTNRINVDTNGDISFYEDTGTTAKFFWDASAESLGIGTSNPTNKLFVESSTVNSNTVFVKNTSGTGANYGLEIAAGTNSTDHALHVTSSTGSSLLRVNGAGNVGIGTSSPSTKLTVLANSANGIDLAQDPDDGSNSGRLFFTTSGGSNSIRSTSGALQFSTGATAGSSSGTERMRIDASGAVGLSTTPPAWNTGTSGRIPLQFGFGSVSGRLNDLQVEFTNNAYASGTGNDPQWAGITRWAKSQIELNSAGGIEFKSSPVVSASAHASSPNINWTKNMEIDVAGSVTKPYQPNFKAGRSGNYTPGVSTAILFNDTSGNFTNHHWNVGNHYSTSTGRFTAPVTGTYLVQSLVIFGPSLTSGQKFDDIYDIVLNNNRVTYSFKRAEYVDGSTGNGGYYTDHSSALVKMSANEYIWCRMNYSSIGVHGNTAYSWFSAYLLG